MYITREKFKEICKKHNIPSPLDESTEDALNFVQELLKAEAEAIKTVEPEATASIDRLELAAYEVYDLCGEVMNEEFGGA